MNQTDKELTFVVSGIAIGILATSLIIGVVDTHRIHKNEVLQSLKVCETNDGVNHYQWVRFDKNEVVCNNGAIFKLDMK